MSQSGWHSLDDYLLACCVPSHAESWQHLGGESIVNDPSVAVYGCAGFGGEMPFNYFCYGAALSEVELDTLTGDFHLLRTDLCMDVGQSLNPAIDIGQVQPSFIRDLNNLSAPRNK